MPASIAPPSDSVRSTGSHGNLFATRVVDHTPPPAHSLARSALDSPDEVEEAARAYRRFRTGSRLDVDALSSLALAPTGTDAARVFAELHVSSPDVADRLAAAVVAFPEVGGEFLGFRLEGELGRGAFGRVYLA